MKITGVFYSLMVFVLLCAASCTVRPNRALNPAPESSSVPPESGAAEGITTTPSPSPEASASSTPSPSPAASPSPQVTPSVLSVTSSVASGTYTTGKVIDLIVRFSEKITISGTPALTVNAGNGAALATYVGTSGEDALEFRYTAQVLNDTTALDYASTSSLTTAGTITSALGVNANLTLPAPGASGSLSASKAIAIVAISRAIQVVSGDFHSCALLANGNVRCWGDNFFGQLGYGNTNDIGDDEIPAIAGDVNLGGNSVVQLSAGGNHTCALFATGDISCWGYNFYGQLGYGHTNDIGDNETPTSAGFVDVGARAIQVAAGGSHTCALTKDGTVRCWGSAFNGQLGYGNQDNIGDTETPASAPDVNIGAFMYASQITAGGAHTCIIREGGVFCWGDNFFGQLGIGLTANIGDDEAAFNSGLVPLGKDAIQVVAGNLHTCALLKDHTVNCWGAGIRGQLGDATFVDVGDDEAVTGHTATLSAVPTSLFTGPSSDHTCALLENRGLLNCWGKNVSGQLGLGHANDVGGAAAGVPVVGADVLSVSTGSLHTCALLVDGNIKCWGDNSSGQLGNGNDTDYPAIGDDELIDGVPIIALGGDKSVKQIVTGDAHACALLSSGKVKCWGASPNGQTGYAGTDTIGNDETPSSAGEVDVGGTVIQLASYAGHTCALLAAGTVRCWGQNGAGQLGYGNTSSVGDDETPAAAGDVSVGATVIQIATGGTHTCALLVTGGIKCWGLASSGQLGYGNMNMIGDDETPSSLGEVPLGVGGPVVPIQIATGGNHTCALLSDGTVTCWGRNDWGQLGYRDTVNRGFAAALAGTLVNIGVGIKAREIAAGQNHTCALTTKGEVFCWGQATNGQLGYGNATTIGDTEDPAAAGPISLGLGTGAVHIAAGGDMSCAILDTGDALCWGLNTLGSLGSGGGQPTIGLTQVPSDVGPIDFGISAVPSPIKLISTASSGLTCGLFSNGKLKCWGSNTSGQLGLGNSATVSKTGFTDTPGSWGWISIF